MAKSKKSAGKAKKSAKAKRPAKPKRAAKAKRGAKAKKVVKAKKPTKRSAKKAKPAKRGGILGGPKGRSGGGGVDFTDIIFTDESGTGGTCWIDLTQNTDGAWPQFGIIGNGYHFGASPRPQNVVRVTATAGSVSGSCSSTFPTCIDAAGAILSRDGTTMTVTPTTKQAT